jgi:hypothetical protein
MHTLFSAAFATLAACALLAADVAHASASGATSIANVTLGVIDLTPQDGGAGFTIDSFDSRLMVYTYNSDTGADFHPIIIEPAPFTAGQARLALDAATADATATGAIGEVSARATAGAGLGLNNMSSAESEQRLWLTLAPHTLLTVSGDVRTQANRSLGDGAGYHVFSWASVDIADRDMVTSTTLSRESALIWGEATSSAFDNEYFTLAFANPSDAAMAASMNFLAYTDVTIAAVPEPATYGMLMAGLLMVGAAARRGDPAACRRSPGCRPRYAGRYWSCP